MHCRLMPALFLQRPAAIAVLTLSALAAACGGGGRGGNNSSSPTSPTNPNNANLTGTWTGSLSRPGGLSPVAVRWAATQESFNLSGPFTMTYNGISIQVTTRGTVATDNGGLTIGFQFFLDPGASPVIPSCSVVTEGPGGGPLRIPGVTPNATSLTSSPFDITYRSCRGFIENDGISGQHVDAGVILTLTKQ